MNTFGHALRLSIFGESHGPGVGIIIDGVPAGLPLTISDFQFDLKRRLPRRPGTTFRQEEDIPQIISGLYQKRTTGGPLLILFTNQDIQPHNYNNVKRLPRPGHADLAALQKFCGFNDLRGGGSFSGRLTVGLVAAGVIAKKIIAPAIVQARVMEVRGKKNFQDEVLAALKEGDSVGGLVECRCSPLPIGLGEPFFDSVESLLSHLLFSIPAIKGIEFGSGFNLAKMRGSEANDLIVDQQGRTLTNHNGGITGGLTNGNELYLRVAVKPTPSISRPQPTVDLKTGLRKTIKIKGRHDTCIALRMPVIVEAAVALVLADLMLRAQERKRVWGERNESD
ncbi:chorismate synthase [Candidatus Aminicenantes bacterium AC-334-K16]|jgi:chorismate synthase|nr:chorismate synthase [Candidatus Aminicenantes bacterium AC-334-K16]